MISSRATACAAAQLLFWAPLCAAFSGGGGAALRPHSCGSAGARPSRWTTVCEPRHITRGLQLVPVGRTSGVAARRPLRGGLLGLSATLAPVSMQGVAMLAATIGLGVCGSTCIKLSNGFQTTLCLTRQPARRIRPPWRLARIKWRVVTGTALNSPLVGSKTRSRPWHFSRCTRAPSRCSSRLSSKPLPTFSARASRPLRPCDAPHRASSAPPQPPSLRDTFARFPAPPQALAAGTGIRHLERRRDRGSGDDRRAVRPPAPPRHAPLLPGRRDPSARLVSTGGGRDVPI
jgi:hypothetical protein